MEGETVQLLKDHIKKELKKKYTPDEIEAALLHAGFDRNSINQALVELKIRKPGFLAKVFAPKEPAAKKPVKIEIPQKPAEKKPAQALKPAPAKPKKSFITRLFRPRPAKAEAPQKPKPAPAKKQKEAAIIKSKAPEPIIQEPAKITQPPRPAEILFWAKLASTLLIIIIILGGIIILFSPKSCATKECFLEKANACERAAYQNVIAGARINYESRKDCTIVKTIEKVADTEPQKIKEAFEGKSMVCAYYKNDFSPMHIETISGLIVNCEGPLKQEVIRYVI